MAEFEVRGRLYRSGRIDARKQFHIVRRFAPVLPSFSGLVSKISFDEGGKPSIDPALIMEASEPLTRAMASMPDEDADYIINEALKVTQRALKNSDGTVMSWSSMWNAQANVPKFDDTTLTELMQIVWHTVQENLEDFFAILRSE